MMVVSFGTLGRIRAATARHWVLVASAQVRQEQTATMQDAA